MIVRDSLVFFPLIHGRPTNQHYVFTPDGRRGLEAEPDYQQKAHEYETFHDFWQENYLCGRRFCASGRQLA
jgi:hypothetical protein